MHKVMSDDEIERNIRSVEREHEDDLGPLTDMERDRWRRLGRGEITIEEADAELKAEMQAEKRHLDG